jgi:hypothetical protein
MRRCNLNPEEEFPMTNKLLSYLVAGALATTLALASPALARGGGGGGGHGGGMVGGGHWGGGGGHWGGMGGGAHFAAAHWGGTHWSGTNRGMHFAHAGFSPRFSRFAFHHRFHHRFHRFAFVGDPYLYADYYGDCWRSVWTRYGLQSVNVCGDYGY